MLSIRHRTPRLLLQALVALSLVSVSAAPLVVHAATNTTPRPVTVLLDWLPNTDHAGIYAALAQGTYGKQGLSVQVNVPGNATNGLQEVATGHFDFVVSYEADVLMARAQHLPVKAVMAVVDRPLNTILTLRSSHITRLADLRGKSVGIAGVPGDYAVMKALEQHAGLPASSVHLVNVGYSLLPALLSGKVQAVEGVYWTWEAVQLALAGHPDRAFHIEQLGVPNYDELVLVTSDQLIHQDPALVRRVVAATVQGYAFAHARPAEAAKLLLHQTQGLNPRLVRESLALLAPAFDYGVPYVGYMNPSQWQRYLHWLEQHHLISGRTSVAQAMTDAFLPHVK